MWPAEQRFTDALAAIGWRYVCQPRTFKMAPPHRSYRPDFYVEDNDTYYEVVGSRTAFFRGRAKYKQFVTEYPRVKLVVIDCGANVRYDYHLDRLEAAPIDPADHET